MEAEERCVSLAAEVVALEEVLASRADADQRLREMEERMAEMQAALDAGGVGAAANVPRASAEGRPPPAPVDSVEGGAPRNADPGDLPPEGRESVSRVHELLSRAEAVLARTERPRGAWGDEGRTGVGVPSLQRIDDGTDASEEGEEGVGIFGWIVQLIVPPPRVPYAACGSMIV